MTNTSPKPSELKVGDKVLYTESNYPGVVIEVCAWEPSLIVVALRSGRVCASWREFNKADSVRRKQPLTSQA